MSILGCNMYVLSGYGEGQRGTIAGRAETGSQDGCAWQCIRIRDCLDLYSSAGFIESSPGMSVFTELYIHTHRTKFCAACGDVWNRNARLVEINRKPRMYGSYTYEPSCLSAQKVDQFIVLGASKSVFHFCKEGNGAASPLPVLCNELNQWPSTASPKYQ